MSKKKGLPSLLRNMVRLLIPRNGELLLVTEMKAVTVLLLIHFANGERSSWIKTTPKEDPYKNIGPPPKPIPVYISPFISDGVSDPITGLKSPVDFLALRMIHPRNEKERRHILKTKPLANIQFIAQPSPPPIFYNPRDKLLSEMKPGETESQDPMWFNYEAMQNMNLNGFKNGKAPRYKYQTMRTKELQDKENARAEQKFQDNLMMETGNRKERILNWTTCDEFKKKAKFHPKDLLEVDWLPFYTWSEKPDQVAILHKFSKAPLQMVVRIKQDLGSRLTHKVDWNQHKLMMENNDKVLLIAADQSGLFHAITDLNIPDYFKRNTHLTYPAQYIRFKFVNQYLAMMECDKYYATMMAPIDNALRTDAEKIEAAQALKFIGIGQPVSRNLEQERINIETKQILQRSREESKFIVLRDQDYVVEKDKHLDLWSV